jgi:hypothetical protein
LCAPFPSELSGGNAIPWELAAQGSEKFALPDVHAKELDEAPKSLIAINRRQLSTRLHYLPPEEAISTPTICP